MQVRFPNSGFGVQYQDWSVVSGYTVCAVSRYFLVSSYCSSTMGYPALEQDSSLLEQKQCIFTSKCIGVTLYISRNYVNAH